jgi:hypothetical protein
VESKTYTSKFSKKEKNNENKNPKKKKREKRDTDTAFLFFSLSIVYISVHNNLTVSSLSLYNGSSLQRLVSGPLQERDNNSTA